MTNEHFVKELSKLRSSSTFLSLIGYRNEHSEVADYSIIFHMSYENALKRSISFLEEYVPKNDLESTAQKELIKSFQDSLNRIASTPIEEVDDAYTRFFDEDKKHINGIKMHRESGTLHLYGLVVHKRILLPGIYQPRNKKPLTLAKDRLRNMCPVGKFRQFKLTPNQVDYISVDNISLLPPS